LVYSVSPHLSNVDVLPLKRKELREYILVSPVSTLRLFLSLTCILLVTCLLACLPLIGNSPSCTSSEFTSCQALNLKRLKIDLAPIHPPSSRPYRSFHICPAFCLGSFRGEGSCSLVGGVQTWLASYPSFASVDLVGARPLLAKQPLEESCLHRPALALLGGVASRLLAQPALRAESVFLS
jgi:hypothetical protein